MKAHARSVFHLFDGKRRYLIPLFQRQYVWTQARQWEPLWEDIASVLERRRQQRTAQPHFMGAVVLDRIATFGNQVFAQLIIDGQQRLTTYQIILTALRDVASLHGAQSYAEEVQRYLLNTGIMERPEEEQFNVWPTRVDQVAFTTVITGGSLEAVTSHHLSRASNLVAAYQFFHDAISRLVSQEAAAGQAEKTVELLYQALRDDLEVVSIELEGDDDPQVIFETLNARGEPLLPSDLLRNFLFWRASRGGENREALYDRYWLPLDQHLWKKEMRVGRLKRPRIDVFLQHFLEAQEGQEINVARLFHEYRAWILESRPYPTVEEELRALTAHAEVFRRILEETPDQRPYGIFFWRIRELDVGTVYPLLLLIFTETGLDQPDIVGMLTDLESYLFRRLICGLTPKNYNKVFLQLVRELRRSGLGRQSLQQALLALRGDAGVWPNDKMFAEAWLRRNVYSEIKPAGRLLVVLRAIEDGLRTSAGEDILIRSTLTVEHVMPQAWEKTLPLSDGRMAPQWVDRLASDDYPEAAERDRVLHTVGNLTLLTRPLNTAVSNAPYQEKRPAICAQSALALNRHFQGVETWGPAEINERGRRLLDVALRVWPYPPASGESPG
jgi:hypothetical protein